MRRLGRAFAIGCALLPIFIIAACMADRAYFASNNRQREILAAAFPDVECRDADFDLRERSDAIQDWYYVVRISGSQKCVASLRRSLNRRGFVYRQDLDPPAVALPGSTTEQELVSFDFDREPGAVFWTRDKT